MEFNQILLRMRRQAHLTQMETSKRLAQRGLGGSQHAISKWESGQTTPDAIHFLALCEIYGVEDIAETFIGKSHSRRDPFSPLNSLGRERAQEYISLLSKDARFSSEKRPVSNRKLRTLALYDLPVSAGTGQFLDGAEYEMIEVDDSVPVEANFAVRVSGDSMTPRFSDGQIVYVHMQQQVDEGEFGIFLLNGSVYLKKMSLRPSAQLISLNSAYPPIGIHDYDEFRVIGRVVQA